MGKSSGSTGSTHVRWGDEALRRTNVIKAERHFESMDTAQLAITGFVMDHRDDFDAWLARKGRGLLSRYGRELVHAERLAPKFKVAGE
jgi:hypothetical protein